MQLMRKAMSTVWDADIPLSKKLYLVFFFFGTRLFATHIVSFVFYCTLVPICAAAPEVVIPFWALVYMPILVTLSTVCFTPGGWIATVAYVLFENALTIVKLMAMLAGIFELSDAHEWVVTAKLGKWVDAAVTKSGSVGAVVTKLAVGAATAVKKTVVVIAPKLNRKVYFKEICMGLFFIACGLYGVAVHALWHYSVFLCAQGAVFLAFGLNYVDGY